MKNETRKTRTQSRTRSQSRPSKEASRRPPKGAEETTEDDAPISDRRRLKGEASRERILDAALRLFSERGYSATGVHEIARRAGIEKAALYWHFGSKEGLLAAVLDRMDAEYIERIQKRVFESGSPDERLDRFVNGLRRLVVERSHLVRLTLSVALERAHVSPVSRAAMLRIFERTRTAVVQGFEQALGTTVPDLDLIARLTLAYLYEAAVRAAVDPEGAEHDRFFAQLRRLIILELEHQTRTARIAIQPDRIPKRK